MVFSFFFFFFFFLAIWAKYFPDARLSPQIRSGPVHILMKSIIFSGNNILFLDFSNLLIGRLRKSGEQRIDIMSLLLNKFSKNLV